MPRRFIKTMTIVSGLLACRSAASGQTAPELAVLTGTQLAPGYVLTVNSSENMTGWVTPEGNSALRMQYPEGQRFGAALFSVVGSNRPEVDLSFYQTLIVEISGESAEPLELAIRDSSQTQGGPSSKVRLPVTQDWRTHTIALSRFAGVDRKKLAVVAEFIFSGSERRTVRVRSIRYSTSSAENALLLPQVVFGGGWSTILYFTNTSVAAVQLQVRFFAENGSPVVIPGLNAAFAAFNLEPRSTMEIAAPDIGSLVQGYASATTPDSVVGYALLRRNSEKFGIQETPVYFLSEFATSATLIWDETTSTSTVAVLNTSGSDATLGVDVRDGAGAVVGAFTLQLPAKNKFNLVLRERPELASIAGKRGSAVFTASSGTLAVIGFRFTRDSFTSIPALHK